MTFLRGKKIIENSVSKDADPDQMTHSMLSDLGLHCLSMSHKRDAILTCIWVNRIKLFQIKI